MKQTSTWKTPAGLGIVALLGLSGCLSAYVAIHQRNQSNTARVEDQVARLEPIVAAIPPGPRVGYVTDAGAAGVNGATGFLIATYAIAPRLLVDVKYAKPGDPVLGAYARPGEIPASAARNGLVVERDFGSGLVLLRKVRP